MEDINSNQRVKKTLAFGEPDRVPLDIGSINNTSMHVQIEEKLFEYLGFSYPGGEIVSREQQAVVPNDRILEYFGADTRSIYISDMHPWTEQPDGTFIDQWGLGLRASPDNTYFSFCSHPLASATSISDLDRYQWPDPYSENRLAGLEDRARKYAGQYCLVLEGFRESIFGLASWLRGMTEFYMDLAIRPEFAHALLDRLADFQIELTSFVIERIGQYIDVVKVADDIGTQRSLMISPDMYREFIKPRQAALYKNIREKSGCPLLLHACGSIRAIIPDLIEIGVDALNPIQVSAKGMDPRSLKETFGGKITFWGGGIDTQEVLPTGTPQQIEEEVHQNMEIFKPGGGYIFSQVHNITHDVPVENVVTMFEAYKKYAAY
jgi:uroporphyrinogen decarboxylase